MCATFTDDDVGKTVVNANGEEVGIVSAIEHGSARVEPDPGITDTIKAKLGWEGTSDDTYPLQESAVERVTDDEVRLQGDLSGVGGMDTGTDRVDTGTTATGGGATGTDTGMGTDTDRDDDLIGDDDDSLIGDDDDSNRIGDDDDRMLGDDDDDDLIGDDDDDGIAGTDIGSDSDSDDRDRDSSRGA